MIAGIIVDSSRDAIRRGKLVRDMDVAALPARRGGGVIPSRENAAP
ncbi:MAG: hypothetical protein PS018_28260 [bacterium]|nr:hypothetical protein [bacterium]